MVFGEDLSVPVSNLVGNNLKKQYKKADPLETHNS